MDECKPLVQGARELGRAVRGGARQVDPIKPMLKPPGTKHWKLQCNILLSTFAFKFYLRRYDEVSVRTRAGALVTDFEPVVGRCRLNP